MTLTSEAQTFLRQNTVAAGTLADQEQIEAVDEFAEHHAGGLVVLGRYLTDGRFVKMHDSWGDDGKVVVHAYNPEFDSGDAKFRETEEYFDTGAEALARFLHIDDPEDRVYCVGLPVTVVVTASGEVRYEVDLAEAASAIRKDDCAVPIDEDGDPLYSDDVVSRDSITVEAAVVAGTARSVR